MTELVVVSGKGGTGKTTLVGALASLSGNKVLVDCDVDAADLHLIVNHSLRETNEFTAGKRASIITAECTNCGVCYDYCRFDAIKLITTVENKEFPVYTIDPFACDGCGVCVRHCPHDAIAFGLVKSGEWFLSDTPYGTMVHARLGIAQANSGKLVSLLRQKARQLALNNNNELIIIDGPPGIGCPVIASVTGASYILIVTEPSLSAIQDMERLLELTTHFNIPTGICINKYDINEELTSRINNYAVANNITILGRIPFAPAVTKAQLAKTTVIDHNDSSISENYKTLWSKLKLELELRKLIKYEIN